MGTVPHKTCHSTGVCNSLASTTTRSSFIKMSDPKPSSELLSAIQSADSKGLKDVTPVENPAAKHDMTMYGVEKFDKNKLTHVETTEKVVLPSAEDIKEAKEAEATP